MMKRLLSLLVVIVFYLVNLKAQNYNRLLHSCDSLYSLKQYKEAATKYDLLLAKYTGKADDYYNAACSWALTGDTAKALFYLENSVSKGYKSLKWLLQDKSLESIHSTNKWPILVARIEENQKKFEDHLNKPLKAKLENIYVKDQSIRQLLSCAHNKFSNQSEEIVFIYNVLNQQDSLNALEIVKIIDIYGWLGINQVGEKANKTIWLVIQHAPLELQSKYLSLLKESVSKGESNSADMAYLEDRILMREGKPQLYGTQLTTDKEGKYIFYEIINPEFVNERRYEVGLGPIEEYAGHWKIAWNVQQK